MPNQYKTCTESNTDAELSTPATVEAAPSLSQLLQAHRTIADMISTGTSAGVDLLRTTAEEIRWDISLARAASWEEFGRKVQLLVDNTTEGASDGWLTAVQEGVYWDLKHLAGESATVVLQAAE
ncbi:hypothetical protein [Bradyrhizobium glycinis]|uniref:hypothetical protein n=1 Tax=Bradyrhizobium glycinis TaxID=2751812 RepID=UPI0018D8B417|nr:hypothetical protein [Bradyrhizobium glycinis]MBH5371464.1 hypothetical protein [Bradyrhizobium glycinis]